MGTHFTHYIYTKFAVFGSSKKLIPGEQPFCSHIFHLCGGAKAAKSRFWNNFFRFFFIAGKANSMYNTLAKYQ